MKTEHTPGPWYESKTGNHQGLIIAEETGENIAVCYQYENAALISAAPELLLVLKGAKASLLRALAFIPPDDDRNVYGYVGEWIDEINEVIAKAEGQP